MVSGTRDNPPLETTLRSVYMELWVVTAVPSSTLVSLETARQVTHSTKWRAPETIWAISPRVGKPKCLYEKKLSRLTGLPYLPRWDNSPTRVVSPPPRRVGVLMQTVSLIFQRNKWKVSSARVARGKGCLGYPRPYKQGLIMRIKITITKIRNL